jgi:hypothetical protein
MKPFSTKTKQCASSKLAAVLVTLALCTTSQLGAANLLFNGNLDQTEISSQINASPTGWIIDGSKSLSGSFFDGADSEPWCNVVDQGGFGVFFKPFQGSLGDGDLLTVQFYQDNPATAGTKFTLSGYAAGEANFCAFFTTNSPAPKALFVIEFLDNGGTVLATNTFDLVTAGLPSGGPGSMSSFQYTTPEVTAPANTTTVRAGAWLLNAYGTTGAQSFFVDGFDLESVAAAGSPVITNQPAQQTVAAGANAVFTVGVSNTTGVTYQWQHAGTNLSNGGEYSGANTASLTVTGVSTNDIGHYRVLVSNGSGSVYSADATLTLQTINIYPVISLTGKIGDTYRVDYSTALNPTTWIPLTTVKLTSSPQTVIDTSYPQDKARFYRSVFLY